MLEWPLAPVFDPISLSLYSLSDTIQSMVLNMIPSEDNCQIYILGSDLSLELNAHSILAHLIGISNLTCPKQSSRFLPSNLRPAHSLLRLCKCRHWPSSTSGQNLSVTTDSFPRPTNTSCISESRCLHLRNKSLI